ncbi:MAG TPA: hypothetical protein PKV71_07775 [Calditrichia bacterium]|nr:hypothetical protein [Calditrichota bacterium]HQU74679.1 hypothetical protein [Calditrichia bacterium]HQV31759.1 hypothetical protein [Calditrichia bacterium]
MSVQNRCPFCFEKLTLQNVHFRCVNTGVGGCEPVRDEVYARYARLSEAPLRAAVFASGGKAHRADCPKCQTVSTIPACPACHNDLPYFPDEDNSLIIAVAGARNAGKSHFLGVLIQTLQHQFSEYFEGTIAALNDLTGLRFERDFQRYLYDHLTIIPVTPSARSNRSVRLPLVYRLSFSSGKWLGRRRRDITLVFLDSAGEDLEKSETMVFQNPYLALADGIIFLADPLQIRAVRETMPGRELPERLPYDQLQLLHRLITFINARKKLKKGEPIATPLAFCFSKIDLVGDRIDPHLLSVSPHRGFWEKSDGEFSNELWLGQADRWLSPQVMGYIQSSFRHIGFFGISALGNSPDPAGRLRKGIHPIRISDPLLWLLNHHGLIPAKRSPGARHAI